MKVRIISTHENDEYFQRKKSQIGKEYAVDDEANEPYKFALRTINNGKIEYASFTTKCGHCFYAVEVEILQ